MICALFINSSYAADPVYNSKEYHCKVLRTIGSKAVEDLIARKWSEEKSIQDSTERILKVYDSKQYSETLREALVDQVRYITEAAYQVEIFNNTKDNALTAYKFKDWAEDMCMKTLEEAVVK